MKATICPNLSALRTDTGFIAVTKHYPNINEHVLAIDLQLYREHTGRSYDFYPSTPQEFAAFTRFRHYINTEKAVKPSEDTIDKESMLKLYSSLYKTFTADQLEDRLSTLTALFSRILDKIEQRTGQSRTKLLQSYTDGKSEFAGLAYFMNTLWRLVERNASEDYWRKQVEKGQPGFITGTLAEETTARLEENVKYIASEYRKLYENKDRLSRLVLPMIGEREGFRVGLTDLTANFDEVEEKDIITSEIEEMSDEESEKDDTEGTKGERYQDMRTVKLAQSLSPRLRRYFSSIQMASMSNDFVTNDIGFKQMLDPAQTALAIQEILIDVDSASFMEAMQNAEVKYPWLRNLVKDLKTNTDMQALVYCTLAGVRNRYTFTNYNQGGARKADSKMAGYFLAQQAKQNILGGRIFEEEYGIVAEGKYKSVKQLEEIYDKVRVLSVYLNSATAFLSAISTPSEASKKLGVQKLARSKKDNDTIWHSKAKGDESFILADTFEGQMQQFLDNNEECIEELVKAVRGLGFDCTVEDIKKMALTPMTKAQALYILQGKGKGRGESRRGSISDAYKYLRQGAGANRLKYLGLFLEEQYEMVMKYVRKNELGERVVWQDDVDMFTDFFPGIHRALGASKMDEVASRIVNEGKSFSTIVKPNMLHRIAAKLNGTAITVDQLQAERAQRPEFNAYQQYIKKEFCDKEGMSIVVNGEVHPTGILRALIESNIYKEPAQIFTIWQSIGFNHIEYAKMTEAQKATNSMLQYFTADRDSEQYEIPIQGDYATAHEFITMPNVFFDTYTSVAEALVDEVLIELQQIERARSRKESGRPVDLRVYDQQQEKFHIFPEFNRFTAHVEYEGEYTELGFYDYYTTLSSAERKAFLEEQVQEALERVIEKDIKKFEEDEIFKNPNLKFVRHIKDHGGTKLESEELDIEFEKLGSTGFFATDGKFESLKPTSQEALRTYFERSFYYRQQFTKVFNGGAAFFSGVTDYEKRNGMMHAPATPFYSAATYKGERVAKDTENVAYITDVVAQSAYLKEIDECLRELKEQNFITQEQYKQMRKNYTAIKETDGQGLRTMESYRSTLVGFGMWTDELEAAYKAIESGHPKAADIDIFMQMIKPVYTGFENLDRSVTGYAQDIRIPVFHKYSETVLLPTFLAQHCLQAQSAPFMALAKANEVLRKEGTPIDLFIFNSGVKVGGHTSLNIFNNTEEVDSDQMADAIIDYTKTNKFFIHKMSTSGLGIAASMPAHGAGDAISMASQAKKKVWANIQEGETLKIRGVERDSVSARYDAYVAETAIILRQYNKLREMFNDPKEFEKLLQEEIADMSYASRELSYAFTRLRDGNFVMPLYSPNLIHQVEQIISAVIRKRLTKTKFNGSNIMQVCGLGMDVDSISYSDGIMDRDKLGIHWATKAIEKVVKDEETGEEKTVKETVRCTGDEAAIDYVDAFVTIKDKNLLQFADESGAISPERLEQLVGEGKIPEQLLHFMAYRTPSDAEHSIIHCRVKGFLAKTGGDAIILPKEVMVLTGHDYDGDKMRCHFAESKMSHGELQYIEFDEGREAIDQSNAACYNYQLELMLAKISSPAGTRRMLIPGSARETAVMAKTLEIIRQVTQNEGQMYAFSKWVKEYAVKNGKTYTVRSILHDGKTLYDFLSSLDDIDSLFDSLMNTESPYSVHHAVESFASIIENADMIGIYAMYGSALDMLQRADIRYVPKMTKTENPRPYVVSLFGHEWDKLFQSRTSNSKTLATLVLGHLLQSAVDNNKEPIMKYLHQYQEFSDITFLMCAAGMDENEIHIIFNQPAVIELIRRMKLPNRGSFGEIIDALISEYNGGDELAELKGVSKYPIVALEQLATYSTDDMLRNIGRKYNNEEIVTDLDAIEMQVSVLQFLRHIKGRAETMSDFVKLTRPETGSGGLQSDIVSLVNKNFKLQDFIYNLENAEPSDIGFTGMAEVLALPETKYGYKNDITMDAFIDTGFPEVAALNKLMMVDTLEVFSRWFPHTKVSWMEEAKKVVGLYRTRGNNKSRLNGIYNDMLLWKLFSDKKFITEDVQAEQKHILINVPKQLQDLNKRIAKAVKARERFDKMVPHFVEGKTVLTEDQQKFYKDLDYVAEDLANNALLKYCEVHPTSSPDVPPRILFKMRKDVIEGSGDVIRNAWNDLYASGDAELRQLAIDLFKYNIFNAGFGYGMYSFHHFAPTSVLLSTPGYRDALTAILYKKWDDEYESNNFLNQYIMNHWGDTGLLNTFRDTTLKINAAANEVVELSSKLNSKILDRVFTSPYVIVTYDRGEGKRRGQALYRVVTTGGSIQLVPAQKLGHRGTKGQVTLQYNPGVDYTEIRPVVPGTDSAWGQLTKEIQPYGPDSSTAEESPLFALAMKRIQEAEDANPLEAARSKVQQSTMTVGQKARLNALDKAAKKAAAENAEMLREKSFNDTAEDVDFKEVEEMDAEAAATLQASIDEAANIIPDVSNVKLEDSLLFSAMSPEVRNMLMQDAARASKKKLSIAHVGEDGKVVTEHLNNTPANLREARKQAAYVSLNERLREMMRRLGVREDVITEAEARLGVAGVAEFDTAKVLAEGMCATIRLAEGKAGEEALPEEFAHIAIEMLGHEHPLVQRLFSALGNDEAALREAFGDQYEEYRTAYTEMYKEEMPETMIVEAAGKLVAKALYQQAEIKTRGLRGLIHRVCDAIKAFFRKLSRREIEDSIFEAENVASSLARELLSGRMLEAMSKDNIKHDMKLLSKTVTDLTGKEDILSKLLQIETKRLAIFTTRAAHSKKESAALKAAKKQVKKIKKSMTSLKMEASVVSYIKDSLDFLQKAKESLDKTVSSGASANVLCRRLNVMRDTLYSFSSAAAAIEDAIVNKEITDTVAIRDSLNTLSGVLNGLFTYYRSIALPQFEMMLSNIYGPAGLTVTIGDNKGKTISIHEMATMAPHDISVMSRLFHSLADCDDNVLKAFDLMTRTAKQKARKRSNIIKSRIETAAAALKRETGSLDQDFMFEKKAGKRTGKYISEEASMLLSKPQKAFYDEMMAIEREIDEFVPSFLVEDRHMVMVRKLPKERAAEANSLREKGTILWEGLLDSIRDTSNGDPTQETVLVDFEGNKVDNLPIKFLKKGERESYEDMSDDVATSMMLYAGMAHEYDELNNIIGILENARYMANERKVTQVKGIRMQQESIKVGDIAYTKPFTKKGVQTNICIALNDFMQMHLYGHIEKAEGNFGHTKISKRKVVNKLNRLASLSQMALNIPQRIANIGTGMSQIMIESAGKGLIKPSDISWASGIYVKESGDRLADTGKTASDNKLSLFAEYFDLHQDNGRNTPKYKKGTLSRVFNQSLLYAGLTAGEDYLALTTGLAVARKHQVKHTLSSGKTVIENLWDAYEVRYRDTVHKTGAYLALKDGYTELDGSAITEETERKYMNTVANLNQKMQGIYNLDDRSAVQQYALGALVIMYRKWMAPALARRYSKAQYNTLSGQFEEGYYVTVYRAIRDAVLGVKDMVSTDESLRTTNRILADIKAFITGVKINWKSMTPQERSNVIKVKTELGVIAGLWALTALLLNNPPEDEQKPASWLEKTLLTQILRLRTELTAQAPTPGFLDEAMHIIGSPFAALGPLQSLLNGFRLLMPQNYTEVIKSGRYRGHVKAYKYFRELPIIAMFKKIDNVLDPTPLINYYVNDAL